MTFVTVRAEQIGELSVEAQEQLMQHELVRIDRDLPLGAVISQRRAASSRSGDPYDTAFDHLMWDIVGNPYKMFGPKHWHQSPAGEYVQYGYHLFTGLSDDGEMLSVNGAVHQGKMSRPEGYQVHSLHLPKGEITAWRVQDVELSPPGGTLDIRLHVGRVALDDGLLDEEATISFRTPSNSDASLRSGETSVHYNRNSMKNLYAVVHAFDAKYRLVEAIYMSEAEQAEVVPLQAEQIAPPVNDDAYMTAA